MIKIDKDENMDGMVVPKEVPLKVDIKAGYNT